MNPKNPAYDEAEQEQAQGCHDLVGGALGGRFSNLLRLGLGMGGTTLTLGLDSLTVGALAGALLGQFATATLLLELAIVHNTSRLGVRTENIVVDDAGALRIR